MFALPSKCKPSAAVGTDKTRPVLSFARLARRGDGTWLEATNSYIAVAVRIEGEVKEGLVPVEVLRLIESGGKGLSIVQVDEATWTVTDLRGVSDASTTYSVPRSVPTEKFPDLEGVGLYSDPKPASDKVEPFGFDPSLLSKVGKALGGNVRVDFKGPLKPLHLRPIGGQDDRRALLMPVRLLEVAPMRKAA